MLTSLVNAWAPLFLSPLAIASWQVENCPKGERGRMSPLDPAGGGGGGRRWKRGSSVTGLDFGLFFLLKYFAIFFSSKGGGGGK